MDQIVSNEWVHNRRMMMIGSPSREGKMVIKLKIPKLEPAPAMEVIGKRVCLVCNKEFSSGKALGGHMRVHVHPHPHPHPHVHLQSSNIKNPNLLKPSKPTKFKKTVYKKPCYMNSVNDEGKPTCSQCGKTFPSMKSLFGHMRCHPERDWRGILPPTNTAASVRRLMVADNKPNSTGSGCSYSSSSEGSKIDEEGGDQVVDLTKFLRGWSVTERRGRKALKVAADEDEGLLEAVEDLMSLANAGTSMAESNDSVTIKDNKIDGKSPEINVSVTGYGTGYGIGKGKAVIGEEIELKPAVKLGLEDEQLLVGYKCNKIKRRKKMKLMMELEQQQEQPIANECKYKCTTCNKCFSTHQALGGHRSSHNKTKFASSDHNQIVEEDYESLLSNQSGENSVKEFDFEGVLVARVSGATSTNGSVHQCKICDKVFGTGQALGGHQRCHWSGISPSSQVTSTGEGASQTESGRKVFEFDLNEVPSGMMEEDEGANVNGNGYASSSYNSNMG